MRRPGSRAALSLAILIFGLFHVADIASAGDAPPRGEPWLVLDVAGEVVARHGGQPWQPLRDGAVLPPESEIRTGPAAMVVLAHGEDRVQLMSRSSLTLSPEKAGDPFTRLIQSFGRAVFEVDPRPDPHFEVETPYLTAIVKGTVFTIETSKEGASVTVDSGVVGVAAADGSMADIRAGQVARALAGLSGLRLDDAGPAASESDLEPDWPTPDFNPVDGTIE